VSLWSSDGFFFPGLSLLLDLASSEPAFYPKLAPSKHTSAELDSPDILNSSFEGIDFDVQFIMISSFSLFMKNGLDSVVMFEYILNKSTSTGYNYTLGLYIRSGFYLMYSFILCLIVNSLKYTELSSFILSTLSLKNF
jgi:hypothetical protein